MNDGAGAALLARHLHRRIELEGSCNCRDLGGLRTVGGGRTRRGVLYRGEIQHPRWPLQRAELELSVNRYADLKLGPQHPDVWFSPRVDVVVWPLDRLAGA